MTDRKKSPHKTWLKNPKLPRTGEQIGAGHFVFRRGDGTNRIRPGHWPFEHPTLEAATAEAMRLSQEMPGCRFDVVSVIASVRDVGEPAEFDVLEAAE